MKRILPVVIGLLVSLLPAVTTAQTQTDDSGVIIITADAPPADEAGPQPLVIEAAPADVTAPAGPQTPPASRFPDLDPSQQIQQPRPAEPWRKLPFPPARAAD